MQSSFQFNSANTNPFWKEIILRVQTLSQTQDGEYGSFIRKVYSPVVDEQFVEYIALKHMISGVNKLSPNREQATKELIKLFADVWDIIKFAPNIAHPQAYNTPFTKYCLHIAQTLQQQMPQYVPSVNKLLMPTIVDSSDTNSSHNKVDEMQLGTFILNEDATKCIPFPLEILDNYEEELNLKKKRNFTPPKQIPNLRYQLKALCGTLAADRMRNRNNNDINEHAIHQFQSYLAALPIPLYRHIIMSMPIKTNCSWSIEENNFDWLWRNLQGIYISIPNVISSIQQLLVHPDNQEYLYTNFTSDKTYEGYLNQYKNIYQSTTSNGVNQNAYHNAVISAFLKMLNSPELLDTVKIPCFAAYIKLIIESEEYNSVIFSNYQRGWLKIFQESGISSDYFCKTLIAHHSKMPTEQIDITIYQDLLESGYPATKLYNLALNKLHEPLMNLIFKTQPDIVNLSCNNTTLLHSVLYYTDHFQKLKQLQFLIKCGVPVNQLNTSGETILTELTNQGHANLALELAKQYPELINLPDHKGETLIFSFIDRNQESMIRVLTNINCNINQTNEKGLTPLDKSLRQGLTKISKLLLERNANFNKDESATIHLHRFIQKSKSRSDDVVKLLIEHGVCVTERDKEGETVLTNAIRYGTNEMIKYLIESNPILLHLQNTKGKTPLEVAYKYRPEKAHLITMPTYSPRYVNNSFFAGREEVTSNGNDLNLPMPERTYKR